MSAVQSLQDVLSAQAAGACSAAVTTGKFTGEELAQYRPTHIIGALTELPALLEREPSMQLDRGE